MEAAQKSRVERVRFISHQGKQVLLVDFTQAADYEIIETCTKTRAIVSGQPQKSVLILGDFTGGKFTREAVKALKEATAMDKPFVKRAAWVGAESLPKAYQEAVATFSTRQFPTFATREEALDWLVKED